MICSLLSITTDMTHTAFLRFAAFAAGEGSRPIDGPLGAVSVPFSMALLGTTIVFVLGLLNL
jgi:hypothetical protein